MNFFWLDASAYAKRYVAEKGTQLINYLFTHVPLERMVCLSEGGGEIIFVFVRRRNEVKLPQRASVISGNALKLSSSIGMK